MSKESQVHQLILPGTQPYFVRGRGYRPLAGTLKETLSKPIRVAMPTAILDSRIIGLPADVLVAAERRGEDGRRTTWVVANNGFGIVATNLTTEIVPHGPVFHEGLMEETKPMSLAASERPLVTTALPLSELLRLTEGEWRVEELPLACLANPGAAARRFRGLVSTIREKNAHKLAEEIVPRYYLLGRGDEADLSRYRIDDFMKYLGVIAFVHMANDHEKRKLAAKLFRVNILPHDQEAGGMEIGSASPHPQEQREITFKDLE
ncbi:MAG: hypothetical protein Q8N98_03355, partial [bacterium]|nr:hypothetical protein [bacterium]